MSTITTWNEAAKDKAMTLASLAEDMFSGRNLERIDELVDREAARIEHLAAGSTRTDLEASYVEVGAHALAGLTVVVQGNPLVSREHATARELIGACATSVAELLADKQHDYGTGNILKFAHDGLWVRMSDKVERIKNLRRRGSDGATEPLEDAWVDIVGYSIVGLMLLDNQFELPLEAEAPGF